MVIILDGYVSIILGVLRKGLALKLEGVSLL